MSGKPTKDCGKSALTSKNSSAANGLRLRSSTRVCEARRNAFSMQIVGVSPPSSHRRRNAPVGTRGGRIPACCAHPTAESTTRAAGHGGARIGANPRAVILPKSRQSPWSWALHKPRLQAAREGGHSRARFSTPTCGKGRTACLRLPSRTYSFPNTEICRWHGCCTPFLVKTAPFEPTKGGAPC